ncbi:multidrug efflux system outer membrane protein [Novosphingobium sp. PhB57]|uniref:efflux transporter outer membrane subunit n=1 Tax=Novosphingobium sp. PhB57 TaxID=2485107 RepID=UPI001046E52D|nr:efflux transporter outer membrane subunit [Novosphingobium sp. PhB57]TCU54793.1 multidrug efflux system outer membrane protein [Novosphingobium sp. PhB57]
MRRTLIPLLVAATALAGCNMAPKYVQPEAAAPAQWPQGAAYAPAEAGEAGMPWRTLLADPRLQSVIERALANNQNLQASLANVASARAQYHVERSYQLPTLAGTASATGTRGLRSSQGDTQTYSANAGFSAFELDLFGRLKNQSREALETYLSTESGYRSARLTLVANVATAYVTLASDRDLLTLAQETRASGQRSVDLTQSLLKSGLAAAGDLASAQTVLEQANSDVASQTTLVAQDRNALELLVGGSVEDALLPASLAELDARIGQVPAGLSSEVLLRRPDVVEAEHQLKGAYAQIGAARAAFFPTISLTSALGLASTALGDLFTGGALGASGTASASLPILGGTNKGNLEYAKAQREYYLATYRAAVQSAFKDVADALARRGTITEQRAAQDRLVTAAERSYRLADAQYRAGTDTYLDALVAQRSLYAYRQTRIATILADLTNRITVYSAVGADDTLAGPVSAAT